MSTHPIKEPIPVNPSEEIWADVRDFVGYYQVSTCGRVRSLDRWISHRNNLMIKRGRVLRPSLAWFYLQVELWKDGVGVRHSVHRLVASTFVPNPNKSPQVNHKDGNKVNNNHLNLEWVTAQGNCRHAKAVGLTLCGENHLRAKLTNKQAEDIRTLYKSGLYQWEIAKMYSVTQGTICRIVRKESYCQ